MNGAKLCAAWGLSSADQNSQAVKKIIIVFGLMTDLIIEEMMGSHHFLPGFYLRDSSKSLVRNCAEIKRLAPVLTI